MKIQYKYKNWTHDDSLSDVGLADYYWSDWYDYATGALLELDFDVNEMQIRVVDENGEPMETDK